MQKITLRFPFIKGTLRNKENVEEKWYAKNFLERKVP